MKLPVPYYSQFVDIQDSFWMLRACGGISLKMVAEYHGKVTPDILTLCHEAKERGGYHTINGWVHDYLVAQAKELGLQAYRKEGLTNLSEIITSIESGNPVIVSVEKRLLEQKRFHMIVITGFESIMEDSSSVDDGGTIFYHEPESTDKNRGEHRSCSVATFMEYFRGKAIFVTR